MSAAAEASEAYCVVFMPMLAGFEAIRAGVARGIGASGMTMLRLEEVMADHDWQYWLLDVLPRADLVLADVTDHNPFVMYELGLAHARRVPALLAVDARNERVSATVLGTPFIPYDVGDIPAFERELAAAIGAFSVDPGGPELPDAYRYALALAEAFTADTAVQLDVVSPEDFATRLAVAAARGDSFPTGPRKDLHLLARLAKNADDVRLMRSLRDWCTPPPA